MLLLAGAGMGLLVGILFGGRPARLAHVKLSWPLLVIAALLIRYAVMEPGITSAWVRRLHQADRALGAQLLGHLLWIPARYVYVAAMLTLVAWTAWHARRLPGLWLVVLGILANLIVILANDGHMPVSPELAGDLQGSVGQYTRATDSTHLTWLDDWIALPGRLGGIFPETYSPGDLSVAAGMAAAAFEAVRWRAPALPEPDCGN